MLVLAFALLAAFSSAQQASLSCGSSLCFASGISSGGVLQSGPERAAVYGSTASSAGGSVFVHLASSDGGGYSKHFTAVVAPDLTWKALLDAMPAGGNFTMELTESGSAQRVLITDLTFGDIFFCAGQSNAWLPLWFTFERNATTAKVAAGGYSNLRLWRGGLQETAVGGNWVGPKGVEPGSDSGEALSNQWRHPIDLIAPNFIREGEPWLWEFPSMCFYTAQFLTDKLIAAGRTPPPIGIMTVPVGGTMVEQWTSPATQQTCRNVTCMCQNGPGCDPYAPQPFNPAVCTKNSDLFYGNVQPFVNLTIRAFLWLQVRQSRRAARGRAARACRSPPRPQLPLHWLNCAAPGPPFCFGSRLHSALGRLWALLSL